ncbi:secondary thiamine-phosphate synthase enzyme YjbQ [Teredinibacter sp. KSP-S5-2]|uniref:secondary thiamine-phosphate synthase enzyme YjbQ n=1 Tax=Teredinibacter sp. KSP-S5-2 TaxID=3034506 RepID=UPI0029344815|nr:secondary thiamine-phosphate synthase enzyme YjbQ [Teredinibacter sp. KSP-S5-2]WNO08764.1 secondary thiamine-phosphate synthase enzyme YjbQ [Teredinibacter sp. KSP-S5-2]
MIAVLSVPVRSQGLFSFTHLITPRVDEWASSEGRESRGEGLCTLFVQHTSASLIIQENYDPSAQRDLEAWLNRLVPENDPLYTHTLEGADDMPAHIKATLTATSLSIPVMDGRLALGTWQGVYLWEHRRHPGERRVVLHIR